MARAETTTLITIVLAAVAEAASAAVEASALVAAASVAMQGRGALTGEYETAIHASCGAGLRAPD